MDLDKVLIFSTYELLLIAVLFMAALSGLLIYIAWKRGFAAGEKKGYEKRSEEQNSYLQGKIDGGREELEKLTISYEPFVDIHENFFRKSVDAGYQLQIFYNGMPLGDPTRRVVRHNEKFKDENVKQILDQVNEIIRTISKTGNSKGIPVRTSESPNRSRKKK